MSSILLYLLGLFASFVTGNWFTEFFNPGLSRAPVFSGSQLYNIDIGLEQVKGTIEALGDFNNDKYTDIFVVNQDRQSFDVYLWNRELYSFKRLEGGYRETPNITNIGAGDFNYDGKLDLKVTGNQNGTFYIKIYFGELNKFKDDIRYLPETHDLKGDVLILDSNGDLRLDLFGMIGDKRAFWKNYGDASGFSVELQSTAPLPQLLLPNANAFVDIDGDCLSDLVITSCSPGETKSCEETKQFEIWLNRKGKFEFDKSVKLPVGAGQLTFGDFNGDGTMDVVFPVCWPTPNCTVENSIYLLFNQQKRLCGLVEKEGKNCRSSQNLCTGDPNYQLNIYNSSESTEDFVIVPATAFQEMFFLWTPQNSITLRTGDYNLDGYPDLLIPLVGKNGPVIQLWKNSKCTDDLCNDAAVDAGRRTFTRVDKGVDALTNIQNPYAATFFDLDENGMLDILVLCTKKNDDGTLEKNIQTIYNNFFQDAFFLKAMGLNGVADSLFSKPKPYGVNYPGAVFKFTISELSGSKRVTQGVQLTQSGNLALQTPYTLFGLGRVSNYIEEFYFSVNYYNSKKDNGHSHMWSGIIPNSQIVGIPYKPENPNSWTLELYIKTSGLTLWVVVAVISWLIVIGGLIYYFTWKEKVPPVSSVH